MTPAPAADRRFVRLWIATTASGLATWALPFVLGLLLIDGDVSATDLGLLLGARTVGFVLAVPLGGVLADRHDRRRVIVAAAVAAAAAMPVLLAAIPAAPLVAGAAAVVAGAGQGACRPAFQALTADVVEVSRRRRANAAISLGVRVSTLVAPALCALLALLLGPPWLLLGIAALWLLCAVLVPSGSAVARPHEAPTTPTAGRRSWRHDLREGWQEARRHPWFLSALAALTAVIATGYSATGVVLPQVSERVDGAGLSGGPGLLAAATTGYVLGATAGALVLARWEPRPAGWIALTGLGLYAGIPFALLTAAPGTIIAAFVLAGIGIELFNVTWFTALQREVRPDALARVSSLDFLLSYGLAPLGLAVIAPASEAFGAAPVLIACGAVCLLAPASAALTPSSREFAGPPERAAAT